MLYHSPNQHFKSHHYLKHKELGSLYASYFIKLFSESFISVFTAIFLLSVGFGITEVALYYIIYFAAQCLISFPARALMQYVGVVKTLGLGIIGYIGYYFLLQRIGDGIPYQVVALSYGMASGIYFSAFNVELAHALKKSRTEGAAVAMVRILMVVASIAGPVVGALFVSRFSFQLLFTIVAILLVFSLLPLFFSGDYKVTLPRFSLNRILRYGSQRRTFVYGVSGTVTSGLDILWPVFIYLNYQNYVAVGGIMSLTALALTVVIYWAGRYADLHHAASYRMGVLSHAPTWVIRLVLLTPGGLLVSNLASSVTAYLLDVALNKAIYHSANQSHNATDYFLYVNLCITLGRIFALAVAALTQNLTLVFMLIALFTFAHLALLPELKNQTGEYR